MSELENNIIEDAEEFDEDVEVEEEEVVDDPLVKAEQKIIALKRENKELKTKATEKPKEDDKRSDLEKLRDELELLKFKSDNAGVLSQYKGVDQERVMKAVRSGLFNIDEACRAIGSGASQHEERAKKAAMGELEPDDEDNVVSDATRTAGSPKGTKLTKSESRQKKELEKMLGKEISDEDFKSAYQ